MQTDVGRGSTLHVIRCSRRQHCVLGSFQASRRARIEQWGEDRSLRGEKHSATGTNRSAPPEPAFTCRGLNDDPSRPIAIQQPLVVVPGYQVKGQTIEALVLAVFLAE